MYFISRYDIPMKKNWLIVIGASQLRSEPKTAKPSSRGAKSISPLNWKNI